MNHSRLWVVATIIAVVVVVGFVISVPHTQDAATESLQSSVQAAPAVVLRDSFKKGQHTITGSIEAPNACSLLTARATFVSTASTTGSILVELSFPEDSGVCLQMPTRVNFSTTVSAPARLPITVTVNGITATTTTS